MQLEGEQVTHSVYGQGRVVLIDGGYLSVAFEGTDSLKRFCYPSAFEKYLCMCNPKAQEIVLSDLQMYLEQLNAARRKKEQEWKALDALMSASKKAHRKPAKKKNTKTAVTTADK